MFLGLSAWNTVGLAQTPFNGVSVQEITIPPAELATIDATLGGVTSARCWRVYACFDDPDWELQAMYGNSANNMAVSSTTGQFYQHPLISTFTAAQVNPAFFGVFPEFEYASWFALGVDNNTALIATTPPPPDPITPWHAGTGFVVNDPIGFSVLSTWLPPNSQGTPDADNKLLIAQFTTDGIFNCLFNFQFRRLNPDGSVYLPVTTSDVTGVAVDGTPGAEQVDCPIVFLPIELLSFTATPNDDRVDLRWTTTTEINNEEFTVQRSMDGSEFEDVTRLPGAGNSELTNHYFAIDQNPYSGLSYYRLMQTDFNGETTYSDVIAVNFEGETEVTVFPNPAKDHLRFSGSTDEIVSYMLTSPSGKIVDSANTPSGIRELNLRNLDLATGVYYLTITTTNGDQINHKLVITR